MITDDAFDAMARVEQLLDERNDLIMRCYRIGHGPVTSDERRQFANVADEISGLYGQLSEYYRRLADLDRERI
ncbi:hypothetical protein GCM10022267_50100 [Lentzea roselyniae]|uniref:Spo0E like sporulation regulatory protein n=1 Tax=Lentzea roselyniae TaxID=531940 RepID=A0ABP7BFJ0_9PSEU